jgi:hypothetical protein
MYVFPRCCLALVFTHNISRAVRLPTVCVVVSSNAEQYRIVDISGAPNGSFIRERILSKVGHLCHSSTVYQFASLSCASRMMLILTSQYINQRSVALLLALPSQIHPYLNYATITATPWDLSNFSYPPLLTGHHQKIKLGHRQYGFFACTINRN